MHVQLQGLAYIMLIVRAKSDSGNQSDEDDSGYSMASVTGAMYLLVASTTPDLRAGFTLLVDGLRVYQQVFGGALLTLYGLMICAAMKVLFTTSNDDASVVINAVTVLFIADVVSQATVYMARGFVPLAHLCSNCSAAIIYVWIKRQLSITGEHDK